MKYVYVTLLLIMCTSTCWGASYYVDADADTGGDGSLATPWDELSDITGLAAGDTIYLNSGDTWAENFTLATSGSSGSPITWTLYGGATKPIIDCTGDNYCFTVGNISYNTFDNLDIRNSTLGGIGGVGGTGSNIIINECDFSGHAARAILAQGDGHDNWTVTDCTITGATDSIGIDFRLGPDGITVDNNTITGGGFGIRVGAFYNDQCVGAANPVACCSGVDTGNCEESIGVDITRSTIDEFGDSATTSHAIQVFVDGSSDNYDISNNIISDPADDYDAMELAWQANPSTVTIQNNIITNDSPTVGDYGIVVDMYDTGTATVSGNRVSNIQNGCIYFIGGNAHTITRNVCTDGGTNGDPTTAAIYFESRTWAGGDNDASNHVVSYNIIDSWGRCFATNVRDGLTANGIKFYNNVCYDPDDSNAAVGAAFSFFDTDGTNDGTEVKNNIVYDGGATYFVQVSADCQTNFDADYNIYYGSANWKWGADADDTTIADWRTASSGDANSTTSDPLFADASNGYFLLNRGSPAIDAGDDLSLTTDYPGGTVPQDDPNEANADNGTDIGAYEYYPNAVSNSLKPSMAGIGITL